MISSATDVPTGSEISCDVCIVGSGPAGITLSREFMGTTLRTILLESGGRQETEQSRDLLRGYVQPPGSHEPIEEGRRRQFGGTSEAWGGRCVPLDEIDFERRPWIPHSGWPVGAPEVSAYLPRAIALCEAGPAVFDAAEAFPEAQLEMIRGFDGSDVTTSRLERWGPPTKFAARYGKSLEQAAGTTVLLNATAFHLDIDASSRRIQAVEVATTAQHRFKIRAGIVVLACGGLENARLLLASNDVVKPGIGNESDNVGRFYMAHPEGVFSFVQLRDPRNGLIYDFERHAGVYVRRRFWLSPEVQRREEIGNGVASLFRPYSHESLQTNGLISAVFLAKFLLHAKTLRGNDLREYFRRNRRAVARHLRIVAWHAPSLVPHLWEVAQQRLLSGRRLPMLLPRKRSLHNRFDLWFQTEHAPNRDSRVVLHLDRDALGVRRLEARIAFSDLDRRTILQMHRLIAEQFTRTGTGTLVHDGAALDGLIDDKFRRVNSVGHHIGTTRMSSMAAEGVVDVNCRVHGTENLYIAGSSVFPTSGHANPTLTIVVLALRLADYLRAL